MDIEAVKTALDAEVAKSPSFQRLELVTGMALATAQGAVAFEVRAESENVWGVCLVSYQSGEGTTVRWFAGVREIEVW